MNKNDSFNLLSVHNVPAGCLAFAIALVIFGGNTLGGVIFAIIGIALFFTDRASEIWIRKYEADNKIKTKRAQLAIEKKRDSTQAKRLTAAQIIAQSKQTDLNMEDKRTERAKINRSGGFLRDILRAR